jgi:hypothetical protein
VKEGRWAGGRSNAFMHFKEEEGRNHKVRVAKKKLALCAWLRAAARVPSKTALAVEQ